jgi:MraZ protein
MDYFERKLDEKRRMTIPPKLSDEFKSGVVITQSLNGEKYLHLYSKDVWNRYVEPVLDSDDLFDEDIADKNVQLRMGKLDAELDPKQGRITLTQNLMDFAGITDAVYVVRAGKYFRIYAKN